MKPQFTISCAALAFSLFTAGYVIYQGRGAEPETFSFPSEPVEGTEFIIVQPNRNNSLYERIFERTIFRYQQGLWRMKETSIMDYDSTETQTKLQ